MTEHKRLVELIESAVSIMQNTPEKLAAYLLDHGVIVPPCKVGDTVWCLLDDDMEEEGWFISEEHVTDVSARGIWLSQFYPPKDDHGNFILWEQVGTDTFTTREEAEAALRRRENHENNHK